MSTSFIYELILIFGHTYIPTYVHTCIYEWIHTKLTQTCTRTHMYVSKAYKARDQRTCRFPYAAQNKSRQCAFCECNLNIHNRHYFKLIGFLEGKSMVYILIFKYIYLQLFNVYIYLYMFVVYTTLIIHTYICI